MKFQFLTNIAIQKLKKNSLDSNKYLFDNSKVIDYSDHKNFFFVIKLKINILLTLFKNKKVFGENKQMEAIYI